MATWSSTRKSIYALVVLLLALVIIGLPTFFVFYKAPTCEDGLRNGDEQGIDCGGSCRKLCSSAFLPIPSASWVKYIETLPGTYTLAAYIVNPNQKVATKDVPYSVVFIDKGGFDIKTIKGTFDLHAGRNTMIFESGIKFPNKLPARAIIEYNTEPEWFVDSDPIQFLSVVDKKYAESDADSSLEVEIKNSGVTEFRNIGVYSILKDSADNVIDFSRTVIDAISPGDKSPASFTWPNSHKGQVVSIEVVLMPE